MSPELSTSVWEFLMPVIPVVLDAIRTAVHGLELSNRPLCVHSSLRSFGWVEGGAPAVVDGLLSEGCSVMVPSFTSNFEVAPPPGRRVERNGLSYESAIWPGENRPDCFSTDSTLVDADLGRIPSAVVSMPGRVRGDHPLNSFTAVGPLAAELIDDQRPMHVYAPLEELAERGGWIVLMGVDLTSMTLLHLAEARAGRTLFRRWARDCSGKIVESQLGSCSVGFERLQPFIAPVMREIDVGTSHWRAYLAADVLEIASVTIRLNPRITHCPDPDCIRCRDAILGGPIIDAE